MSYYVCPDHGFKSTGLDLDTCEVFCWHCGRGEEELIWAETFAEASDSDQPEPTSRK